MNNNKSALKQNSMDRVLGLVQDAQVPLAIVRWNKHMSQHEDCMCESRMLDQKLCGFCLLSRIQADGLEQDQGGDAHPFVAAAETLSGFLVARHSAAAKLAAE